MKRICLILIMFLTLACSSTKRGDASNSNYKVVSTEVTTMDDRNSINELRFYKVRSALDGMKLMYLEYGEWDGQDQGKHQQSIQQLIWETIELLGTDETFTVFTDGKETAKDYFASLSVLDEKGNDCLAQNHPLRQQLIEILLSKMNALDKDSSLYKLFRE